VVPLTFGRARAEASNHWEHESSDRGGGGSKEVFRNLVTRQEKKGLRQEDGRKMIGGETGGTSLQAAVRYRHLKTTY